MKLLLTVNIVPSELAEVLNTKVTVLGGWVEAMTAQLRIRENIHVAIACKIEGRNQFCREINNVQYYSLAYSSKTALNAIEERCREILTDFHPDIVHIEGTEFLHAKAMLNVSNVKTIVSLQGILNGQYAYQCGQLLIDDMMFSRSLTNILAAWILHLRKTRWYKPRMKIERELLEKADYFIGRTTWDQAHTYAINPRAKYYSCNRVLREPFYRKQWNVNMMERHSIYVGNGYFALKGLHFVFMALPQLIREYPDLKLYVAGYKPYEKSDKRPFFKQGYSYFLKKLVHDLDIEHHIVYTGPLNAEQVADKLAHANVYILCSAIENSPNTLGEAMMVGTPCAAAYVGGVPDMTTDGKESLLYRNDDPVLLAWNIKRIFDDDKLALSLSEHAKEHASRTHDPITNAEKLLSIYRDIMENEP